MYRKPKNLDPHITDELYEKLMDIAMSESDSAYSFGSFQQHFERAVISAAQAVFKELEPMAIDITKAYIANLDRERNHYKLLWEMMR